MSVLNLDVTDFNNLKVFGKNKLLSSEETEPTSSEPHFINGATQHKQSHAFVVQLKCSINLTSS